MIRLSVQASLLLTLQALCCWAYPDRDVAESITAQSTNIFKEDHVGYDLHADMFYYVDDRVDKEYGAESYMSTKVVLGGQKKDISGRKVTGAVNPFAIGSKSYTRFRPNWNRFDVRDARGYQYVGLYSGSKGSFVVNKLRAHLLRELANSVHHLLPLLDRKVAPNAVEASDEVGRVKRDVVESIQQAFSQVDTSIRASMKDKDETSASANVVIITDEYIVTASMGTGRVLVYNNFSIIEELTQSSTNDVTRTYLFGDKRDRKGISVPKVNIVPRISTDEDGDPIIMQLILIESPRAAKSKSLSNYRAFNTILQQFNQHKRHRSHEQEMFSSSVIRLLEIVGSTTTFFNRVVGDDNDAAVALISLTRDYQQIH